jgi:hypothetical protein
MFVVYEWLEGKIRIHFKIFGVLLESLGKPTIYFKQ